MKAYCIVMVGNAQSEAGFAKLKESHERVGNEFELHRWAASTPGSHLREWWPREVEWCCLSDGNWVEEWGVQLKPYRSRVDEARRACFLSHYQLWEAVAESNEPALILEDDALFVYKLQPKDVLEWGWQITSINDPDGATRKAKQYHQSIQRRPAKVCPVPRLDDDPTIPYGLPGASAYIITPKGALHAIGLTHTFGAWPNDALLCHQLCIGMLGCSTTYYTKVQGTPSSL